MTNTVLAALAALALAPQSGAWRTSLPAGVEVAEQGSRVTIRNAARASDSGKVESMGAWSFPANTKAITVSKSARLPIVEPIKLMCLPNI